MIRSFLMIGQSNMAGRGFLTDVPLISDERLHMMRNGRWRPLSEPVNFDRPTAGVTLATSFVYRYIQENPGVEAALIPCADGGTGIDDWLKGMPLYENALFCTRMAMKASTLTGILWHQGEHDSCEELIGDYEEKFLQFYNDLMADIGADVPFIIGGVPLAEYSDDPDRRHYAGILNGKLRSIAEKTPNIYFVSSKGMQCNPDFLHIKAASQREFGERYYKVFATRQNLLDEDISL